VWRENRVGSEETKTIMNKTVDTFSNMIFLRINKLLYGRILGLKICVWK
jgi:hypothetical protein